MKRRIAFTAAAIFGLNAFLCWRLFRVEYLDDFQSNEGAFISIGRFLLEHWPRVSWFPWFNTGTPLENAYFPLIPALVAATAWVGRCSPAHAFHFLAAVAYSAGPVFLFLFARKLSGLAWPSLAAALAWSLFSPALIVPPIRGQVGAAWGMYRLSTVVYYGETPHNAALSLLPLAWLLLLRYWEAPGPRRFAAATVVMAAILLTNALGMAAIVISVLLLWSAIDGPRLARLASAFAMLLAAYLLSCRFLPPSLLREVAISSQTVYGDYRVGWWTAALLPVLAILCLALRGVASATVRFGVLFTACFGGIVAVWWMTGIGILPFAHRYTLEAEAGFCLLASFVLYPLWRRLPARVIVPIAIAILGFAVQADRRSARHLIHASDITHAVAYREAALIRERLPDQRVMASGDAEFWLNLFTDNPQMAAGHEAAANWASRVAVYTIYTGQGAGDQDGPISVLWLKAFGCGAIIVPGLGSRDYFHPVLHPDKFAGLLPLVWREGDDFIYKVPLRSSSLAHVVPAEMLVASPPRDGLDVRDVRRYVEALEDPAFPPARIEWRDPERGQIDAKMSRGQRLSVQISYDAGWRASVMGRAVAVRGDGLGMTAIDPECEGDCVVDLEYSIGTERRVCLALGILCAIGLGAMIFVPALRAAKN